ncbi:cob(I)yrinic acid a,c-diamide adenosyltransferase [Candidimonas sp. SYP-B2681]|uniref:cob(I)yrinic acid a,c-diamide adenosyltransferase n=1 Tax=Candidimonas sp. SYP-B2681 TaxID=2497686 RepID=UPI000F873400|nr:cob(I)yrinic acid a,c-diamide adenosyltransferase [Candidimonas sp. SYP-B2681]RTZ45675.1 cob(I)yrinic acid a,c-diamide adenosyltransferase [Candidimonas sp. SYP-B2681]
MATRLSVITTRTGDKGTTGLGDGSRVDKDSPRIAALGEVDELNSNLGVLRAEPLPHAIDVLLGRVQNDLFDMGAELCIPGHTAVNNDHVLYLDEALAEHNARLGRLEEFILPGGTRPAALAHVARTVCRRAERAVISLNRSEPVNAPVIQYLNRLSDLCFVLARVLNADSNKPDVLWGR